MAALDRTVQGIDRALEGKLQCLQKEIGDLGSLAVAFSGGVDSTFLVKTAHDVLGDQMMAVTARSESFPERELREAEEFCRREGIRHQIVNSEELEIEGFSHNPKNRCYLCKHELFEKILGIAKANGIEYVAEGSNMDDNGDYRPGLTAVAELGVKSPLRDAGLDKEEIRRLSKAMGLPTWNKQSFACLSSRFVYGEEITRERLHMVDQAEQLLLDLGFHQVRVRIHGGTIARIEVLPEEFPRLMQEEIRRAVVMSFKSYGFAYVTMDLQGYRSGSMNETLTRDQREHGTEA
ncbi:MAG: ATP-dependent sacrificial sulfur transferase LarE [Bilifractor sp.]|nr:ATP-dependent sacrificial sulfur transferase LarE [Lachnospiraceae bacterium]MDY2838023.1 ATP-dependent sacrificial sulfur transferase LarE [Bilifractor sp.]